MATRHLVLTIKKIEDGRHKKVKPDDPIVPVMKEELRLRSRKNKQDKILAPIEADLADTGFMSGSTIFP